MTRPDTPETADAVLALFNQGLRKRDGRDHARLECIEQRDRRVILRATTGEVVAWQRCARLEGRSFSELARDAINRYCRQAENAP